MIQLEALGKVQEGGGGRRDWRDRREVKSQ